MRAVARLTLVVLLACPALVSAKDMGPGTVVGRVTNTSSRLNRKIFVQAGAHKWALHLNGTTRIYHAGHKVSVHEIDTASYVKAQGRRIGEWRLSVSRLDIAGDRAAYRKSGVYRKSAPEGYFLAR